MTLLAAKSAGPAITVEFAAPIHQPGLEEIALPLRSYEEMREDHEYKAV